MSRLTYSNSSVAILFFSSCVAWANRRIIIFQGSGYARWICPNPIGYDALH